MHVIPTSPNHFAIFNIFCESLLPKLDNSIKTAKMESKSKLFLRLLNKDQEKRAKAKKFAQAMIGSLDKHFTLSNSDYYLDVERRIFGVR